VPAISRPHTPSSVQLLKDAAARIAELEARTIDGWKLVPIEPTLEMCQADSKIQTYDATFNKPFMTSGSCIYRHMLNAAPAAPVADSAEKSPAPDGSEAAADIAREPRLPAHSNIVQVPRNSKPHPVAASAEKGGQA